MQNYYATIPERAALCARPAPPLPSAARIGFMILTFTRMGYFRSSWAYTRDRSYVSEVSYTSSGSYTTT
jgi:hypothetical protein